MNARLRRLKQVLIAWVLLYPVLSYSIWFLYRDGALPYGVIPPFFTWRLMTDVVRNINYYDMLIQHYDERTFEKPISFIHHRMEFGGRIPHLQEILLALRQAREQGNPSAEKSRLMELKSRLGHDVSFQLIQVSTDSRTFYHSDEPSDFKILGGYDTRN